jgi:capsular polysaccharide biosynthesis protein
MGIAGREGALIYMAGLVPTPRSLRPYRCAQALGSLIREPLDDRPPFTLVDAMRHRYRVVIAVVAACLLAAGALSLLLPKTYEATAIIYLDTARTATDFDAGIAAGDLLQHDFIVLATSRPTLLEACAMPGVNCTAAEIADPEATLAKRISANVFRGTSNVSVTAQAPTAEDAAILANAVAKSMISQDAAEVVRLLKVARDNLDQQANSLLAAMDVEQQALRSSTAGSTTAASHETELARLQAQNALIVVRQLDLSQRQDRLTNLASVSDPALPPTKPEAPSLSRYLLVALVAGLCVGVFLALLLERFDDRIVSPEGLAKAAGIPMTFVSPDETGRLSLPAPPPPKQRLYSMALAHALARSGDARWILVVAASARDHVDTVAAGLSAVAQDSGQRVAVIQRDGHSHDTAGLSRTRAAAAGTSTMPHVNGGGTAAAVAQGVRQENYVDAMSNDLVLVAVPSPDVSPAALTFGRTVKGAVLVATRGVTRFADARRTAELMRASGVDVVSGILVARD